MATQSQKRARTEDWNDEFPKLSKSRACTECKKHKIKCDRKPDATKCVRCDRQGLKCVVNSQLQRMFEEDSEWKRAASARTLQLEAAVAELLRHNHLPPLSSYDYKSPNALSVDASMHTGPSTAEQPTAMTRENSQDPDTEPELVSAPMRSLYEVTKLRNIRSNPHADTHAQANMLESDFISRGSLPLEEAEELFSFFNQNMNQFLWGGIALVHGTLTSVRRSSSLLSAAILAVACLHIPDRNATFDICYAEFITLVSNSTLNRYHTLDEIRSLCIGAFWLTDLSWKLSGHAVRIATEMNLHQSLQKLLRGKSDQFERAQLWFLLYVCDHHFSIAYGRPPVIHEGPSVTGYEAFLRCPSAGPGDVRLVCQVALFITLTQAYHAFGSDVEQPLEERDFSQLRSFTVEVEQWRLLWQPRSADSPYVATYPSKGVALHYHFAKFQLNSLALRALPSDAPLSMDRKEAANIAIASAIATLNMVLYEPDIRGALVGVALFTHTMVAFSAVFLLKVAWKWNSAFLTIDPRQVQDLVQSVIEVMSSVSASEKHLTYHIANGLAKMLDRLKSWDSSQRGVNGGARDGNGMVNGAAGEVMIGAQQEAIFDTLDTYGFDLDDSWNTFGTSLDFFSGTMSGA